MKTYPSRATPPEFAEKIKELSRLKYGRPREEIEAEIRDKHK